MPRIQRSFHRQSRVVAKAKIGLDDKNRVRYQRLYTIGEDIADYIFKKTGRAILFSNAANIKLKLATWAKEIDDLGKKFIEGLGNGVNDKLKKFIKNTLDYFVEALRQTASRPTHPDLILAFVSGSDKILDDLTVALSEYRIIFHGDLDRLNVNDKGEITGINVDESEYSRYNNRDNPLFVDGVAADWVLEYSDNKRPSPPRIDNTIDDILSDVEKKAPDKDDQKEIADEIQKTPLQKRQEKLAELLKHLEDTGSVHLEEEEEDTSSSSNNKEEKKRGREDKEEEQEEEEEVEAVDVDTENAGSHKWKAFIENAKKAVAGVKDKKGVNFTFTLYVNDDGDTKEFKGKNSLNSENDGFAYNSIIVLFGKNLPDDFKEHREKYAFKFEFDNESIKVGGDDLGKTAQALGTAVKEGKASRFSGEESSSSSSSGGSKFDPDKLPDISSSGEISNFMKAIEEKLSKSNTSDDFYEKMENEKASFYMILFGPNNVLMDYPLSEGKSIYDMMQNIDKYYKGKLSNTIERMPILTRTGLKRDDARLKLKMLDEEIIFPAKVLDQMKKELVKAQLAANDTVEAKETANEDDDAKSAFLRQKALKHAYQMYNEMLYK